MTHWYEDEKNVIELAEFLVQSTEISTTDELLDFIKHPEKYTEVWDIYEEQILGKTPIHIGLSKNVQLNGRKSPIVVTNVESCACNNK